MRHGANVLTPQGVREFESRLLRQFSELRFCFAKCVARKRSVALAPTHPRADNDKELPFIFTKLKFFDIIVIDYQRYIAITLIIVIYYNVVNKHNIYTKSYLEERRYKGTKPRNFLVDKKFLNRRGSDYLKTLGLDFPYSKPKELIDHLMKVAHIPQDAIILDFFAGSGTTGEAVLDLNNEDKGKRRFILCTNNEGQIAEEVCYPRIEKIIKGFIKQNNGKIKIDGLGGNLQYYKTDLIPVERIDNINDKQRHELTEKAGQMIAIKENTFEEVEICEWYQIFENKDKTRKTAIYFRENTDKFNELIKKIKNTKTVLYIFSYGEIDKKLFTYLGKNITVEDIPEPILDIYKEINQTLIK